MGFIYAVVGAFAGAWIMSGGRSFFGAVAGVFIGWLAYRMIKAQANIRRLQDRVDMLEQRNAALAPIEKGARKTIDTPARVSVYEPPPVERPEPAPVPPAEPRHTQDMTPVVVHEPGMGAHAMEVAKRWATTGNVPVKVGVLLSFFGVAFLLKYAVEKELFTIPMSVRYLGVAGFATFLLAFGWRRRDENRVFALSIQGGGIGVLFLTVFAALRLHALLSPAVAFALLVVITAAAGVLAVKQESRTFAILGTTGGFLAPLLVSTGSGNHVGLFSYYLILNSAVLGVAWHRSWRELNIVGFGFTFIVGSLWGYQYYVPRFFATTEPFLILYFLFYTVIAILFAFRVPPKLRGYVDGTLVFGTPTIAFALQTQILNNSEYGLAISAAVLAVFYSALALWLRRTQEKNFELMAQAFIVLAAAFGTIAIPLALDDRWTAIAWAMEGAALVWIGVRQKTTLAKMTGMALAFAAGVEYLNHGWIHDLGIPVLNGNFMGGVIISVTTLFSAFMLLKDERGREWQKTASFVLLVWALGWWFGSGFAEIADRAGTSRELLIAILFYGSSFVALNYAANRLHWLQLWQLTLGFLPLAAGAGLIAYGWSDDLGMPVLNGNFMGGAMIAWMALYSARKLRTDERADESLKYVSVGLLVWGLLFWFGTGSMEIFDRVSGGNQLHALLLFGSLSLAAIAYAGRRFEWAAYSRVSLALLPALFVGAVAYLIDHDHFFKGLGALAWPVAIASHILILFLHKGRDSRAESVSHGVGAMFIVGLLAYELGWQIDHQVSNDVWAVFAGLLVLATGAFTVLLETTGRNTARWPFSKHFAAYLAAGLLMVSGYLMLVIVVCINSPGDPAPLPYIPLLNPLDVLSVVAVGLLWYAIRLHRQSGRWRYWENSRTPLAILGIAAFVLSTIAVVRIVQHTTDVGWYARALMDSVSVQSTLSIYWAILGLGGMIVGTKRISRSIWMAGAGLMIIVVLKLFVIDLGNTGTVARIISFLGVGVMLLVVGYFSPVPPRQSEAAASG